MQIVIRYFILKRNRFIQDIIKTSFNSALNKKNAPLGFKALAIKGNNFLNMAFKKAINTKPNKDACR